MAITYHDKYKHRKLNEMILLGSHDAAIDTGGSNAKTQTQDIFGQANDGARFFDLRVAAFKTSFMGGKVELRSYHDATKIGSPTLRSEMKVMDLGNTKHRDVKAHTTVFGVAGFGLQAMLQDAKRFLRHGDTNNEFLMFKFDKSENWPLIYQTCMSELDEGDFLYKKTDPMERALNSRTLDQLSGKLVLLLPEDAFSELPMEAYRNGFLPWKNLYSKTKDRPKQYTFGYPGLQYYGKGGVSHSASGDSGKIAKNRLEQGLLMQGKGSFKEEASGWKQNLGIEKPASGRHDGQVNPDVIGLMYWTTTGPSKSGIRRRNEKMWAGGVEQDMVNIALEHVPRSILPMGTYGAAQVVKQFQPNIIMVDFVDSDKGRKVLALNDRSATSVAEIMDEIDAVPDAAL